MVGLTAEELLKGRPVRDALPELSRQGYLQLLDDVYQTGIPFAAKEAMVRLGGRWGGSAREEYLNFVYHPTRDDAGAIDGIFVHAVPVTDLVRARQRMEENNQRLTMALTATRGLVYDCDLKQRRVVREHGLEELHRLAEWTKFRTHLDWWYEQIHPEDVKRLQIPGESSSADQPDDGQRVPAAPSQRRLEEWVGGPYRAASRRAGSDCADGGCHVRHHGA